MRSIVAIAFFFVGAAVCLSQEINSQADKYFYGYAYEDAVEAYQKQMQQGKLMTNHQRLNLADSYFKTGEFNKAAKIYLEVNKNDTIMSDHRFNTMLQSLSKISEEERVKAFLKSKADKLASEQKPSTSRINRFNQRLASNRTQIQMSTVNSRPATAAKTKPSGPAWRIKIQKSQITVAYIKNAAPCRKLSIQGPGFGSRDISAGIYVSNNSGRAIPNPRLANISSAT